MFSFRLDSVLNKKPAIDGQSRVFEMFLVRSEFQSHDAQKTGSALPNPENHVGVCRRVRLQLFDKRGVHIQPATRNIIPGGLSNYFPNCFPNNWHKNGVQACRRAGGC
jgi:hypothetical protein